jgi:hypothetical protein
MVSLIVGLLLAAEPSGQEILKRVLETDSFGNTGAEISARALVTDRTGATRELVFTSRSRKVGDGRSKSLMRFSAPADLANVGFLQIQQEGGDDERFLFLPELKKSRRVAGKMRAQAFMGTDFSYADLDRRDLRDGKAKLIDTVQLGGKPVWHLEVTPDADSPYGKLELWVRQDNFVALKTVFTAAGGALMKTLTTEELKRIKGRWFITRTRMVNHQDSRSTQLTLEKVEPNDEVPEAEFTVRNLEKT